MDLFHNCPVTEGYQLCYMWEQGTYVMKYIYIQFFSQVLLKSKSVHTAGFCMEQSSLALLCCLFPHRHLWQLPGQRLPFSKWPGGQLHRNCRPVAGPGYTLYHHYNPTNYNYDKTLHNAVVLNNTLRLCSLWSPKKQVRRERPLL